LWTRSPVHNRHIRLQIWHCVMPLLHTGRVWLLVAVLRDSPLCDLTIIKAAYYYYYYYWLTDPGGWRTGFARFASSAWIRRCSKSCILLILYVDGQPVLPAFLVEKMLASMVQCDLHTALVSFILPARTPGAVMELSIKGDTT